MEVKAREIYDQDMQEQLDRIDATLRGMLKRLSPEHADRAVDVLKSLRRLRKDMRFEQ